MGVMGGVGSAWERGARRRHKRRLEVLHAKAELKAAQAGARPPVAGAESLPPITTATAAASNGRTGPTTQGTQLERLFASHDAVTARWLDYELDVAKLIAFPAMSDGRQPLTAAFLRAKRVADGLRPASAKARLTKDQLTEYRNAVADYEVAFDVAERDARRAQGLVFHHRRAQAPRHRQAAAHDCDRRGRDPRRATGRLSAGARRARRPHLALGRGDRSARGESVARAHHGSVHAGPAGGAETADDDAGCRSPARQRDAAAPPADISLAGPRAEHGHGPGSGRPPQVAPLTATVWRGDRCRAIPYPRTRGTRRVHAWQRLTLRPSSDPAS